MLGPAPFSYSLARQRLARMWHDPCGWGYRASDPPSPEPTGLACLALLSGDGADEWAEALEPADAGARWLTDLQRADGALGPLDAPATLCRSTAWAALLWGQLRHYRQPLARALRWLQQSEELAPAVLDEDLFGSGMGPGVPGRGDAQFDTAALAVLALCRNELAGHQWIAGRLQAILEQSLADGGWPASDGIESSAWGPADAGVTGLVLMALRAAGWSETVEVTTACRYLESALSGLLAPDKLSWGLLGYGSWRPRPAGASEWIDRCYAALPAADTSPACLAQLMLADGPQALSLFGISPSAGRGEEGISSSAGGLSCAAASGSSAAGSASSSRWKW